MPRMFIYSEIEFGDLIVLENCTLVRDLCDVITMDVSSGKVNTMKPISLVGNSLYGRSYDVSLKVEIQRALSLHFYRASTVRVLPTRDALVERLCAKPRNVRQPRASSAVDGIESCRSTRNPNFPNVSRSGAFLRDRCGGGDDDTESHWVQSCTSWGLRGLGRRDSGS